MGQGLGHGLFRRGAAHESEMCRRDVYSRIELGDKALYTYHKHSVQTPTCSFFVQIRLRPRTHFLVCPIIFVVQSKAVVRQGLTGLPHQDRVNMSPALVQLFAYPPETCSRHAKLGSALQRSVTATTVTPLVLPHSIPQSPVWQPPGSPPRNTCPKPSLRAPAPSSSTCRRRGSVSCA